MAEHRPMEHNETAVVEMLRILSRITEPNQQLDTLVAVVRVWTDHLSKAS